MELENLGYEVQRIDGTPASILKAIGLIVEEYQRLSYIPKSIEEDFFDEFFKCLIDWIGKGLEKDIYETFISIKEIIRKDKEFVSPFAGTGSKRRFGAQLNFVNEFMETYLRSDLEIKDTHKLNSNGIKNKRLRKLLIELFQIQGTFSMDVLIENKLYANKNIKTIERDMNELVEWNFLRKIFLSPKKIIYELSNRAYYFKDEILKAAKIDERTAPKPQHTQFGQKVGSNYEKGLREKRRFLPSKAA